MNAFLFPHVMYVAPIVSVVGTLFYLGNDNNLTFGKEYLIRIYYYSPDLKTERIKVECVDGDNGKLIQIDRRYFGDFSQLRELKIKKLLKNE